MEEIISDCRQIFNRRYCLFVSLFHNNNCFFGEDKLSEVLKAIFKFELMSSDEIRKFMQECVKEGNNLTCVMLCRFRYRSGRTIRAIDGCFRTPPPVVDFEVSCVKGHNMKWKLISGCCSTCGLYCDYIYSCSICLANKCAQCAIAQQRTEFGFQLFDEADEK